MLFTSVIIYLAITLVVGLSAAFLVKNPQDYLLAGRRLPLYMEAATLFATWFGAETVMGASTNMLDGGLLAVIEDPFGASLCLVLVGLFFAKPLYKMNILTFGDFYKEKFGRSTELIASICLILSYIGWVAAQIVAIGIILHTVNADLSVNMGIWIGFFIVTLYTFVGGMWSVSITDLIQTVFIVLGLIMTVVALNHKMPIKQVIDQTPKETFRFFDASSPTAFLNYIGAWITIGLGSIPQQDIFQRVMSSRSAKVAVRASYWGAGLYLTIALIPLLMVLYVKWIDPALLHLEDRQLILPMLVKHATGIWVQILFFGALLSAIMSTASGALLAPSSILSENIIRHFILKSDKLSDKMLLFYSRMAVLIIAAVSLIMAFSGKDIYGLVGQSSALSMVSLFVPMLVGIYFKRKSILGANISMIAGMAVWLMAEYLETGIKPILYGFLASIIGMVVGAVLDKKQAAQQV